MVDLSRAPSARRGRYVEFNRPFEAKYLGILVDDDVIQEATPFATLHSKLLPGRSPLSSGAAAAAVSGRCLEGTSSTPNFRVFVNSVFGRALPLILRECSVFSILLKFGASLRVRQPRAPPPSTPP